MSPRPGGEADKIGNRYEGTWTVARLLDVLAGDADWLRIEPLGNLGKGVEFALKRRDGDLEAHQVKRQVGSANEWSFAALSALGIWDAARRHAEAGRHYHFVSMVPFRALQELADRARNSHNYASYVHGSLPGDLDALFSQVSGLYGDPETAYKILRRFHVRLIDEDEQMQFNAVRAELLLEGGSGNQVRAALGELVDHNMDAELSSQRILDALRPYEIRRRLAVGRQGLAERVHAETNAWLQRTGRQLIEPVIPRTEAEQVRTLLSSSERVHFVVGAAGGGKTAVLHEAVRLLMSEEVPTLVLRLDRYGTLTSTTDLGRQLGLDVSPVTALAAASEGRPAVLVVDQLDAVSLASGRLPENFDVAADLVTDTMAIPHLHVILVCRQFDVDNDHRIRSLRDHLRATVLPVAPLTDEQVRASVDALGLPASTLTPQQLQILRLPLHLALLATVADQPGALNFVSSQRLFDAYWEHKRQAVRQRRQSTRLGEVVGRLAEVISERQQLAVPINVLDAEDLVEDAGVLVSEQLLVRDGAKIAFFHEAVFDYAFARQWANRGASLVDFLFSGEQELFRRGQVRQILAHLRSTDPARFIDEVRGILLSERVRFHIKDAVLAVLGSLSDPTDIEADLLLDVSEAQPSLRYRLWGHLRTAPWFERFDAKGLILDWSRGPDQDLQERAMGLAGAAAGTSADRLAELLGELRGAPTYPQWLRWVVRFARVSESRPLLDLVLEAVRSNSYADTEHELWLSVHDLPESKPDWAVELLVTHFMQRPDALALDDRGHVIALESRDYSLVEAVGKAAQSAPRRYVEGLLPYVLQVMELTASRHNGEGPTFDRHFSHRYPDDDPRDLDDALFLAMTSALRAVVAEDPAGARRLLDQLASSPFDAAQWLLFQGLIAGGARHAEWAAELLLQGKHRLLCGYGSDSVWVARQLLQAISPHLDDEMLHRLEDAVRDVRFSWESRPPGGHAFTLLSALPEDRLSELGRRRLTEYRRIAGVQQPPEPQGVMGGFIGSPIPSESAARMNDDNWLRAMSRHAGERENWTSFTGGARELSHVLRDEAKEDPARFARLALRFTSETNPAYGDAVLMGVGDAPPLEDASPIWEAVRHIASLGHSDNDRWLGWCLRPYFSQAPLDIVELIRDRALASPDPSDDGWRFSRGDGGRMADARMSGINTARGTLAETLGDLLLHDEDGSRTAVVAPVLQQLAGDPSLPVRVCVAHVIAASMRYAQEEAVRAFWQLVDTDDLVLSDGSVQRLIAYIGSEDVTSVAPLLDRMLASDENEVREAGGGLAAFAALEWSESRWLDAILSGQDSAARKGAASVAAHRLPKTSKPEIASATLQALANDDDEGVRESTAEVVAVLRDSRLDPFRDVLESLIASATFSNALSQLLITLEHAPDRVDDLVLLTARRFTEVFGREAGDIRTGAAGDAREVGQLIIRGLAQSRASDVGTRSDLLDALDALLEAGAYGVDQVIAESER